MAQESVQSRGDNFAEKYSMYMKIATDLHGKPRKYLKIHDEHTKENRVPP
jgi:hypothetical protein